MQWTEIEPTHEFPYRRFYTGAATLIEGKHYFAYITEEEGRYRGQIISAPGQKTESMIDVSTILEAEELFTWFVHALGG